MSSVRFAIAGAGMISQLHARVILDTEDAELIAAAVSALGVTRSATVANSWDSPLHGISRGVIALG